MEESFLEPDFYSPVSRNGYLTPLQRKKLREKRKRDSSFSSDEPAVTPLKRVKKASGKKTDRKMRKSSFPNKCIFTKFHFSESSSAGVTSHNPPKKFFRTSPSGRFKNASFSLSFDFKKSLHKFDRKNKLQTVENNLSHTFDKKSKFNEKIFSSSSLDCKTPCNISSANSEMAGSGEMSPHMKENVIFEFDWPSDDADDLQREVKARSPQPQHIQIKCDETAANTCNSTDVNDSSVKLYPIFDLNQRKNLVHVKTTLKNGNLGLKRFKNSSKNGELQVIDAGQTDIGPTICKTCNMVYNNGHEEDERLHSSYHEVFLMNLKFHGWKEENSVGQYLDGRVIMVNEEDSAYKLKKINDILMIVNQDLGSPELNISKPGLVFVLFVSNEKSVAGLVVGEPISLGFKIVKSNCENNNNQSLWEGGNWSRSSETSPAVCGINRIWVSRGYRRSKIASRMLDCLRCHFIHGHIVDYKEIAFSDPSIDGRKFAASYLGTSCFLVYK